MSKRAAFSILSFLQASIADGTVREDDAEGIEVASTCLFSYTVIQGSRRELGAARTSRVGVDVDAYIDLPLPVQCIAEAFSVSLDSPTDVAAFALPAGQSLGSVLEAHVANSPAPAVRAGLSPPTRMEPADG